MGGEKVFNFTQRGQHLESACKAYDYRTAAQAEVAERAKREQSLEELEELWDAHLRRIGNEDAEPME